MDDEEIPPEFWRDGYRNPDYFARYRRGKCGTGEPDLKIELKVYMPEGLKELYIRRKILGL